MPLFGQLDETSRAAYVPVVKRLATEDQPTKAAEILTFTAEIDIDEGITLVPKALHPAIPAYAKIQVRKHHDSPWGPFTIAELKVQARASTIYVGYCTGAICDNQDVITYLRDSYGSPVQPGVVELHRRYYGLEAIARLEGRIVFEGLLEKPHFISPGDLLYNPTVNLAHFNNTLTLVQEEREYMLERAERGTPRIRSFDAKAFGEERVILRHDLPATYSKCSTTYRNVRYLMKPGVPALAGTTQLKKDAA